MAQEIPEEREGCKSPDGGLTVFPDGPLVPLVVTTGVALNQPGHQITVSRLNGIGLSVTAGNVSITVILTEEQALALCDALAGA